MLKICQIFYKGVWIYLIEICDKIISQCPAIQIFFRFMILKFGISRKSLKVTPTLSVAYVERGPTTSDTPILLLIHGFSTSKDNYIPLYKYFPRRVRVIAMDLPGHGDSQLKVKEDFSIRSFVQHVKKVSVEIRSVIGILKLSSQFWVCLNSVFIFYKRRVRYVVYYIFFNRKSSNCLWCLVEILTTRHCSMFLKWKIDSKGSVYCGIFYFCFFAFVLIELQF